ncbi:MAG: hypothetical protein QOF35_10 [Actinomycetota bacterium]|nr:hypothetical protein [Actinomycetota bacterium]
MPSQAPARPGSPPPARDDSDCAATGQLNSDLTAAVYHSAVEAGLSIALAREVARHTPARARRPGRLLVACDLDRTLCYSAAALGLAGLDARAPGLVVAEVYQGVPISFYTRDAESMLTVLAQSAELVPTTTRTREQYERLRLPVSPRYAIAANGGYLLEDGVPDRAWSLRVAASLKSGCAPITEVVQHLEQISDPLWLRKRRVAEGLFAYLVVEREAMPSTLIPDLSRWCTPRGWSVSVQGRKVYCVPQPLTKSAAVAEVARRSAAMHTAAAGDSILDQDMLAAADKAIRPAHGELHDIAWETPQLSVTDSAGVLGGQEICARLLAYALAVSNE